MLSFICYTHMINEVQSRDIVRGSEGDIIVDLLDGLLVAAPSVFSRVNVRCKSKTDNTHPCFLTVSVSLKEVQALVPVIVMPVQTIHGCLRGILTGAGRTSMLSHGRWEDKHKRSRTYSANSDVTERFFTRI